MVLKLSVRGNHSPPLPSDQCSRIVANGCVAGELVDGGWVGGYRQIYLPLKIFEFATPLYPGIVFFFDYFTTIFEISQGPL